MNRALRSCLWILLPAVAAVAPAAAGTAVELRLSASETYVNEPITLQLVITDAAGDPTITPPRVQGARLQQSGPPSSFTRTYGIGTNVTTTTSLMYTYELTPTVAGELLIDAFEVRSGASVLRTQPERVIVRPSDADQLAWLEVSSAYERAYVGQQIKLDLNLWLKAANTGLLATGSRLLTGQEMWTCVDLRRSELGPFPPPRNFTTQERLDSQGEPVTYFVFSTSAEMVVDRPGPLALDDVWISVTYPTRFGRTVFGQLEITGARRLRLTPRTSGISVLPLPAAGRPVDFTGAVGNFYVTASANPTSVRVGDPIELTIAIRGSGPLDTLAPPALHNQQNLVSDFRVPSERLAGATQAGQRIFTQIIRARRAELTEIPPIEFPYFDPLRARYEIARSEPIPITVRAADTLTPADVGAADVPVVRSAPAEPVDGLRGIVVDEERLLARRRPVRTRDLVAVTATPAGVFFATLGAVAVRRRQSSSALRRRQGARREALRRLDEARALPPGAREHAVLAAISAFVADRLGQPAARLMGRAAVDALREQGAADDLLRDWSLLIERCESASYAGSAAEEGDALPERARDCVLRAEGCL